MPLNRNKPRAYSNVRRGNTLPLAASTTVFEGSALGIQASTGRVRPLVAGDLFAGFAAASASTAADVAGANPTGVRLHVDGEVLLSVAGVTAASVGASVFAADDDTFALTGVSLVGEIMRVPSTGQAVVAFAGGRARLSSSQVGGTQAVVSRAGITADDTGTAWLGAPALLSFSAVLASGTATTVLLEVRDSAGTVATAATIVADTVGQTLRQSLLMRQQSEYRFRRSSGTGSVTVTV